eukprot:CAMPEP_0168561740 /NCGR_PEP_ID=MMETSP0413-20121227/11756_1 /TAXON_ID=136452 /ORGANISM="Filamoeba nolandi, Strain NC-AS-23-1" /LENGTH=494 /DNA_ID=CAMNT_0008593131 /DNA_START=33 /DNA_END=1517 /DNA_ORIENTATION=-
MNNNQKHEWIAVRYTEPSKKSERAMSASHVGVLFAKRIEVPKEKYTLLPVTPENKKAVLDALSKQGNVAHVAEVEDKSTTAEKRLVFPSDKIVVGLKPQVKPEEVFGPLNAASTENIFENDYLVQLPPKTDPKAVCNALNAKKDQVEYAEPNHITVGTHLARPTEPPATPRGPMAINRGDPLLKYQYAMTITKAIDAWKIQEGKPEITVAILDEGVDTQHEDLSFAVTKSYDAADNDTYQEPNSWDGHGTACAGLAVAVHNKVGVRGVASGCSLMPIRIAYSSAPEGDWSTSDEWIAKAIEWAWKNGADVLSNSWGGGAASTLIVKAFERARTQGRQGKGCVVVIAAGNEDGAVSFPGKLKNVLCVSASNEFDEPKTKTSRDGEYWWGSNHGPEVWVAAPGVHNYTTDIMGSGGYDPSNYAATFNGTSSATPIVAGAAALVLCANPQLKENQVREIIKDTADKVGSAPYTNGRNDRMGYGRLNVLAAVKKARTA